ncbi:MAG: DUF3299 domain-containing protein [Bacteriovorax sp.]|nr:DUF3299 domain-containing protein [Bacteriovorax sp.]
MKKILFLMMLIFFNSTIFATEVTWETLKTLDLDPKTKSVVAKGELKKILGQEVTIKGFMMPLDYDAKTVVEFLFMPYVPACMHVPPPPPNQLVLVKMKKGSTAVQPSFYPVEITGKITLDANKDLESSYKMEGFKIKEIKQ